jgi:hypothetical protein
LKPSGKQEERKAKKLFKKIGYQKLVRSWNKLRFLAADRQKWKELIDNLCA